MHFLFHKRQIRQHPLGLIHLTLQIVPLREPSALHFIREVARARRARLADADRLRVCLQNLSEFLALLPSHSFILS